MQTTTTDTLTPVDNLVAALRALGGAASVSALSASAQLGAIFTSTLRQAVDAQAVAYDSDLVYIAGDADAAKTALTLIAARSAPDRRRAKPLRDRLAALVVERDAAEAASHQARLDRLEEAEHALVLAAHALAMRVAPAMEATARVDAAGVNAYDARFRVGVGRGNYCMIDGLVEVTVEVDRSAPLRDRLAAFEAGQPPRLRATFRAASADPKSPAAAREYAIAWADAVTIGRLCESVKVGDWTAA